MNTNEPSSTPDQSNHINTAFVILPTQLLADVAAKKISEPAFTLYAFLKFWEGQNDHLWYGVPTMAERTGFSESKVKRLINELLVAGHITRHKKMGANWHTRCLSHVDRNRKVFVCGEPVNRQKDLEKSNVSCPKTEDPPQIMQSKTMEEAPEESAFFDEEPACVNAKRSRTTGSSGGHSERLQWTPDRNWGKDGVYDLAVEPESKEESRWLDEESFDLRNLIIWNRVRPTHPFPEAKELYLQCLGKVDESSRSSWAEPGEYELTEYERQWMELPAATDQPVTDWQIPKEIERLMEIKTNRFIEQIETDVGPNWEIPEELQRIMDLELERFIEQYEKGN